MISFIHSLQSEFLKTRRSAASWLVVLSALFMPGIVLFARIISPTTTYFESKSKHIWQIVYTRNWGAMGMFFLPLAIILFTSLITNIEFKNNTWKQLHTTPQRLSTIFFAKFTVVMVMLVQLFILFNIGIYLSAVIPSLFLKAVDYPITPYPYHVFLKATAKFFVDCLPIVALQYLISLRFKNYLVPIAGGFALLVASLLALNWKYGYIVPYTYCPLNFKENQGQVDALVNIHICAVCYFVVFTVAGYVLYITKKEKG